MRFSSAAIVLASSQVVSGFNAPAFSRTVVSTFDFSSDATFHQPSCACSSCASSVRISTTRLRMSDEEVPVVVEAMDGVDSEEEMHNTERPARKSGTAKHKKGGRSGKPISELEVGSTVTATVKTTTSYGAFLDIGCQTDALLHISRMADDFVANVEDIVKAGEEVSVRIVSVDTEKNQVAVSMQSEEKEAENAAKIAERRANPSRRKERPQRSGADQAAQAASLAKLSEGFDDSKFVEGEVVSTLDFGAFVRFDTSQLLETAEGEVDGLVHISALTEGRANSVSEFVSVGDKVQIRVRSIDIDGGRVSLSMISKEAEEKSAPRGRKEGGAGGGKRGRSMFAPGEMGAEDWAESLKEFDDSQPVFSNRPLIVDLRQK